MDQSRPDPDALLHRVQADEVRQARGKLKIFFGAAPGVGKTYTMLEAGREQAREGLDVLVGYIEPHVRPETQALVLGLDVLARKHVVYRGTRLVEFDLEAALERRPPLILVDELAHTNAPGSTHTKRWQDIQRLLDAGINVYTTLNVQHLESLRDIIAQITGVVVAETVPDRVFEQADEVELVDLPADDLLDRLREGKVYLPAQAERATQSFFARGNLIALRELALRKAAERVGAQVADYRERNGLRSVWPTSERLLVCVGPGPFSPRLVRSTRRMAGSLRAPWLAVHVETPADAGLTEPERTQLAQTMHLAETLGGEVITLSGHNLAEELVDYARSRNVTKIIVGKPNQSRWRDWWRGSLVYELTRRCGEIDVYVISGESTNKETRRASLGTRTNRSEDYLRAVAVLAGCTLVCWPLSLRLAATNLIMVYLLGLTFIAARLGRGPAIMASLVSVAAFDFFFVPPRFTFAIQDTQYSFTFAVMLAVALTISTLTSRVAFQATSARRREQRTAALYAISHELAAARTFEEVARAASLHVSQAVQTHVALLLPRDGQLTPLATGLDTDYVPAPHDQAVAQWVLDRGELAGQGTATLPGSAGLFLPLRASTAVVGVLGILPPVPWKTIESSQIQLLETMAGLLALAVERLQLAAEATTVRVAMETEKLRSSLLSAVSHDLRTPLAVITGATSTLLGAESLDAPTRQELLQSTYREAERLNRLVANLLDMTRVDAGALTLRKELLSIEEVVGSALRRLSRELADRQVMTHLSSDLPFVEMDELLIEQVLVNLLENAVRYSPPGSAIEVTARSADGKLYVDVADRGSGVAAEDRQRIFEKFIRVAAPGQPGGVGLGLAICRGMIALHGGEISVAPRAGGGCIFTFWLPLSAGQPVEAPVGAAAELS